VKDFWFVLSAPFSQAISIPFLRPSAEFGAIISVSANAVQLPGVPAWNPNQWVYASRSRSNGYFLLIRSGANEGDDRAGFPLSGCIDALHLILASIDKLSTTRPKVLADKAFPPFRHVPGNVDRPLPLMNGHQNGHQPDTGILMNGFCCDLLAIVRPKS
jgi:hypothetical protein